ncbi:MAG: metal-dependent transcriptional regulator [Porphyromonadaceae bacterium]|nr:metal-dependent transcriptional regulator [Porphyromonadaceae bacterium]
MSLSIIELFCPRRAKAEGKTDLEDEEDFLKCVYHTGEFLHAEQLQDLARERGLPPDRLERIVGSLILRGDLLTEPYRLSETGVQRVLRLIRAHRIYEKYLSEHSGHKPEDWHRLANKMEHQMSDAEQARMVSLLRNPLFDPHGDPIPTHTLGLPKYKDEEVVHLQVGQWFRVLHIEDDDETIFALLNSQGLARQSVFLVESISSEGVVLRYEGEQINLPHSATEALSLALLPEDSSEVLAQSSVCRLTCLQEEREARIIALSPSCRGAMRRRLMDLGFVRGSRVHIEMKSPMQNPIAYVVRGTAIALRADQARHILIDSIRPLQH